MSSTPFCFICIDSSCTLENPSSRHQTELDQENSSPPFYKELKQQVVSLGKAAAELLNGEKSSTFQENMQRDVDQLKELRRKLFNDSNSNNNNSFFENIRTEITKKRLELNEVQKSGKSSTSEEETEKPSDVAIRNFKTLLETLQEKVESHNTNPMNNNKKIQIPWTLSYLIELYLGFLKSSSSSSASSSSSTNEKSIVQFEGGLITDADGNILWDVFCHYCGMQIQRGAFGEGTVPRVVRLNSDDQHSCCMECWDLWKNKYDERNGEHEKNVLFFHPKPSPIFDVVETNENTMMRIQASEFLIANNPISHNLGQCMKRALQVYGNRPALGWRRRNFWNGKDRNELFDDDENNDDEQSQLEHDFGWITYSQLYSVSLKIANFLLSSSSSSTKISPFIGISSSNRWEFVACDIAFAFSGFISVGLHTTYTDEELLDVIRLFNDGDQSDFSSSSSSKDKMTTFICDGVQVERFVRVLSFSKTNENYQILCMDFLSQEHINQILSASTTRSQHIRITSIHQLFDFSSISTNDKNNETFPPLISRDDENDAPIPWSNHLQQEQQHKNENPKNKTIFSIIFTSGSSGSPKGVVHLEDSFRRDVSHSLASITPLVTLSYIPLSHSTDRMRVYETLLNGGRVVFVHYAHENWLDHELGTGRERFELLLKQSMTNEQQQEGDQKQKRSVHHPTTNGVEQIFIDSCLVRPTIFISPPRIWKGLEALKKYYMANIITKKSDQNYDIFSSKLFSRVKSCATGGGPTDLSSFEFVKNIFSNNNNNTNSSSSKPQHQLVLVESYGATETGGIAMSTSGQHKSFMKLCSRDVEIRLLDETTGEEMTITTTNSSDDGDGEKKFCRRRGEALIHTDHVAELGYFRNEKATRESFLTIDNKIYFRSGDIVEAEIDPETNLVSAVRVIDRKKNFLKISTTSNLNDDAFVYLSAEEIESFATSIEGVLHACAFVVPKNNGKKNHQYLVMVWNKPNRSLSTDGKNGNNNNNSNFVRSWNQGEMDQFSANLRQSSSDGVVPSFVLVDESPQEWCMNSRHRKNGFLTVSSKVNRAAIERHFQKEFEQNIF